MSDFEDIQRLIRLKRHEQPPPGFVDDFVGRLQHRQRAELLQQSARGLLWERINTYFEGLFAPKWGFAGATVMALVAVFFIFKPASSGERGFEVSKVKVLEGVEPISQEEVSRYLTLQRQLMSRHYQGGFGDETIADQDSSYILPPITIQHSDGGLLPAGFQVDMK
ncbi:hypothetical protein DES53_104339 [Roseimicrobium gellanilyticum]|uniref:Uncharacterized protein n=1 Tax=Roseimicrobium gellanilyticum TaxID=748857 RepID=A0A366HMY3_9BACT|nr:hypothetical protein [Roseimicrobium gellanilyticum]RBP44518.1 hypothetical protein DES53_104339 [Roseimicrobium gellanilyticum]